MTPLPVNEVRDLALNHGLDEIQHNKTSRVIAFLSPRNGTRFNVYYTTGTVGTYLDHPRQGKTQLFRRNVDLQLLNKIFESPRIHTEFGYHERYQLEQLQRKRARLDSDDSCNEVIDDEETAAKKQLEKLFAEKAAVDHEISEVKSIIEGIARKREEKEKEEEEERRRQEEEKRKAEKARREEEKRQMRARRGLSATRVLKESDDFKSNFSCYTKCVAVGSEGIHMCLYNNGTWAYSSGLPDNVYKLLKTRSVSHPSPNYVVLGSMNNYYIRFDNGKSQWVGPENMTTLLQESTSRRVKSVAFGEEWNDYFVVFEDGGYQYAGCPKGLDDKINARRKRGDLDKVTLGPNGEWGLWAKNGRMWWGGLSNNVCESINECKKKGTVTDTLFGEGGYYFIRYS